MLRIGSIQVDILKRLSVLYPPPVILCGVSGRCDGMCYKYRHVYEEKKYKSIYMYICICTIYIYTYIYICIYIYIYTNSQKSDLAKETYLFREPASGWHRIPNRPLLRLPTIDTK